MRRAPPTTPPSALDGRIAGEGHDLSFLQTLTGAENDDDQVFYADVDSLIMGARTWDFMVAHGSWPVRGQTDVDRHARGRSSAELPGARAGRDLRRRPRRRSCG